MKESAKWRSGLVAVRWTATRPGGRGGESPQAFRLDERVAGEDAADVVVPAGIASSLVVVESEFALEVFIYALGSPSLLDRSYEALHGHLAGHRREGELRRRGFAGRPFHDEPDILALSRIHSVVVKK